MPVWHLCDGRAVPGRHTGGFWLESRVIQPGFGITRGVLPVMALLPSPRRTAANIVGNTLISHVLQKTRPSVTQMPYFLVRQGLAGHLGRQHACGGFFTSYSHPPGRAFSTCHFGVPLGVAAPKAFGARMAGPAGRIPADGQTFCWVGSLDIGLWVDRGEG